jgi:hypothetical protein
MAARRLVDEIETDHCAEGDNQAVPCRPGVRRVFGPPRASGRILSHSGRCTDACLSPDCYCFERCCAVPRPNDVQRKSPAPTRPVLSRRQANHPIKYPGAEAGRLRLIAAPRQVSSRAAGHRKRLHSRGNIGRADAASASRRGFIETCLCGLARKQAHSLREEVEERAHRGNHSTPRRENRVHDSHVSLQRRQQPDESATLQIVRNGETWNKDCTNPLQRCAPQREQIVRA